MYLAFVFNFYSQNQSNRFMQFFPLYLFFSCSLSLFSLHPATAFACELSGAVPWEEITSSGFDPSITSPSLPLLQHVPCGLRDRGTQIHPPPNPSPPRRPFHLWKRRLIAIHALSGSPMQTGAVVFSTAWVAEGWFPGEISDGPADEQFAKSRFQFARTSHAKL